VIPNPSNFHDYYRFHNVPALIIDRLGKCRVVMPVTGPGWAHQNPFWQMEIEDESSDLPILHNVIDKGFRRVLKPSLYIEENDQS
jgi:hypothetical protein